MKIPVIKELASTATLAELAEAEEAILNEQEPRIAVEGKDEGEKLTHILAAREILLYMEKEKATFAEALRHYSQRVRKSIS